MAEETCHYMVIVEGVKIHTACGARCSGIGHSAVVSWERVSCTDCLDKREEINKLEEVYD
jgi:hypothetical protein